MIRKAFAPIRTRANGFALVVTLALMVLIALVCVALLSLSSIALRQSSGDMAIAKANARMAMMIAIGQLQSTMGPDTRVTAPADQQSSYAGDTVPGRRWIGAYHTLNPATGLPPVGRQASGTLRQWSTDARSSDPAWRGTYRLAWLVSQAGDAIAPDQPGADPVEIAHVSSADEAVRVPAVKIQNSRQAGRYAYWISDESQKARLDIADPNPAAQHDLTGNAKDGQFSLAMLQNANAASTPGFSWHGEEDFDTVKAAKLSTPGMAISATGDSERDFARKNLSSFTTWSAGVPADVVTGGLKVDLGAFLENESATSVSLDLKNAGRGLIGDFVSFIPGERYATTGATYGSLRAWRNMVGSSGGSSLKPSDITLQPRFPANRDETSRPNTGEYVQEGSSPDIRNKNRMMVSTPSGDTEPGTPVHPVMAEAAYSIGFAHQDDKIRMLLYPMVKLWNPYNANLTGADYVVVMPLRVYQNNLKIYFSGSEVSLKAILANAGFTDSSEVASFSFAIKNAAFAPGECKVFVPKSTGTTTPYSTSIVGNNLLASSVSDAPNGVKGAFVIHSNQYVPEAVRTNGGIPGRISGGKDGNGNHIAVRFNASGWFLKGVKGGNSLNSSTPFDVYRNKSLSDFPTLQSIYLGINGSKTYPGASDENMVTWSQVSSEFPLLSNVTSNTTFPDDVWMRHARFLYPEEEYITFRVGSYPRHTYAPLLNAAPMADWNPRANINVRFPMSMSGSFFWQACPPFGGGYTQSKESLQNLAAGTDIEKGHYIASPFWPSRASYGLRAKRFPLFDVQPRDFPLLSLGRLRHASLLPFAWQPAYPIGHSRSSLFVDPGATVRSVEVASRTMSQQWQDMMLDDGGPRTFEGVRAVIAESLSDSNSLLYDNQMLVYDLSFDANNALFDRYFLSSLPRKKTNGRVSSWNGTDALPNGRMIRASGVLGNDIMNRFRTPEDQALRPAEFLVTKGAFNINSTDVEAWKAVLSGLRNKKRKTESSTAASSRHPYARAIVPLSANSAGNDALGEASYSGIAALDDNAISSLAQSIVGEVRKRGPFLGLSDFINRRLIPGTGTDNQRADDLAKEGTLAAAIRNVTSLNAPLKNQDYLQQDPGGNPLGSHFTIGYGNKRYPQVDYSRASPSRLEGLPGTLAQGDLLEPLAPVITARGDTFVIRSYGEALAADGTVAARAWCETVVQRASRFLVPGTEAYEPFLSEKWSRKSGMDYPTGELERNERLAGHPLNGKFGRAFDVVSFRWLQEGEI